MADTRKAQIATWTAMRREGKLRYVAMRGPGSGACMAVVMTVIAWIKTGSMTLTAKAVIGFIIAGLMTGAFARSEWNKFASIYPDIGIERDSSGR
ncbi:MAG TPA: hypothetical protein VJ822_09950 [Dongiaceae bacterium]|nr:hypothetical protein [Dongiaceae bacterium]